MTDYDRDRGAYAPSGEAPLAFDPRSQGGYKGGRAPTTLIVSALILVVLVGGVLFMFKGGVRHAGEPPVVGQSVGDIKQPAPASSQPAADDAAGLSIYKAEEAPAPSASPSFAPLPEQPQPRPAPVKTVAAAPAPALKGPASPSVPAALTKAPAATPEAAAAAAPAAATPAVAETAAAPGAGRLVQIGAFSSTAQADKGWNDVAKLLPGEMFGRTKSVEPVVKDGQTLYRGYIGGFASKAEAQSFCAELKAQSHSCLVK
jgi:cell division septation protein DedD